MQKGPVSSQTPPEKEEGVDALKQMFSGSQSSHITLSGLQDGCYEQVLIIVIKYKLLELLPKSCTLIIFFKNAPTVSHR